MKYLMLFMLLFTFGCGNQCEPVRIERIINCVYQGQSNWLCECYLTDDTIKYIYNPVIDQTILSCEV